MSKSFPEFPSFSNGVLSLNGQVKAKTVKNGDTVQSDYNLSDFENKALQYVQETLANKMPELNVFSADVIKNINSQLEAYKNNAINSINKIYEPLLNNLKNDIASRFGSFSNSTFMNNLNDIESKRAEAISSLAQNLAAQRSELENNELAKRYEYLNFLNNYQNNFYNNLLNAVGISQQNASMGNSYNASAYGRDYNQYLSNQRTQNAQQNANNYMAQMLLSALIGAL